MAHEDRIPASSCQVKGVKTGQRPSGDKNIALRVVCTRQKSFASPLGKNLQITSHLTGP